MTGSARPRPGPRPRLPPRFQATGTTSSLVLADRSAQVDSALREEYPRVRTARARTLSGSGVTDGWAAGQRADLGGSRLAGSRQALPG